MPASENEAYVLVAEISERLDELRWSLASMPTTGDRQRLDYARLIAYAIRDRIDLHPRRRIQALADAVDELVGSVPPSDFQDRAALDAVSALARSLRSSIVPSNVNGLSWPPEPEENVGRPLRRFGRQSRPLGDRRSPGVDLKPRGPRPTGL